MPNHQVGAQYLASPERAVPLGHRIRRLKRVAWRHRPALDRSEAAGERYVGQADAALLGALSQAATGRSEAGERVHHGQSQAHDIRLLLQLSCPFCSKSLYLRQHYQ